MNYDQARQRKDGRWDYTRRNDGAVWPLGYCAPFQDPADLPEHLRQYVTDKEIERTRAAADKHHTNGHETAEEAEECYKQYLLDHNVRESKGEPWGPCEICKRRTPNVIWVGEWKLYRLCDEHKSRELLEQLVKIGACAHS